MSCAESVVDILRNLLDNMNVGSRDLRDYVKRHGYCIDCLEVSDQCACEDDTETASVDADADDDQEPQDTPTTPHDP
jgi:hypothetical protein